MANTPIRAKTLVLSVIAFVAYFLCCAADFDFAAGSLHAATFRVNSTADSVDTMPGDGACRTSLGETVCTLRAAIQEANARQGGDTIVLPAGTYTITIPGDDDSAAMGDLDITDTLTIQGAGADQTIIDGGGLDRVFDIDPGATAALSVTIEGVTVQNGRGGIRGFGSVSISDSIARNNTGADMGGGVYLGCVPITQTVELNNVLFAGNTTLGDGGGILVVSGQCAVFMRSVSALGNTSGGSGGGIAISTIDSTVMLDGITAEDNSAAGNGGGVYYGASKSTGSITSVTARGNSAAGNGGGIYYESRSDTANVSSLLAENNLASLEGGGIYVAARSLEGSWSDITMTGNRTQGNGGGLFISSLLWKIPLSSVAASGNAAAGSGGGGYISGVSFAGIENVILENNSANENGGGLWYNAVSAKDVINFAIARNSAGRSGGGVYGNGVSGPNLSNGTLTDNVATGTGADEGGGGATLIVTSSRLTSVTIAGNTASHDGGGVKATGRLVTVLESTIENNDAGNDGGGIHILGILSSEKSLLSGNTAGTSGGGVYHGRGSDPDGSYLLSLQNVTFSGNSAASGGGLYDDGTAGALTNATLADNSASSGGGGIYIAGSVMTVTNSILVAGSQGGNCGGAPPATGGHNISSDDTCGLSGLGDLNSVDPLLGPLADNLGPTRTHALLAGSPAIDGGDDAACMPTDQRDMLRPGDGNGDGVPVCDVGAYEFRYVTVTPSRGTIGTEMTIRGTGFGDAKGKVLVGPKKAKVLTWGPDSITCLMKQPPPLGIHAIDVIPKGAAKISDLNAVAVVLPEITKVFPENGYPGEEIAITGNYFGSKKGKVFLGSKKCKISAWSMDPRTGKSTVRFVVPDIQTNESYYLTVVNRLGSSQVEDFYVADPEP